MKICNLDEYPLSDRHATYGGMAGSKEGITINGEYWIIKYPKTTLGLEGDVPSYTSSPLSEYIGSHIYEILGFDVHETVLGYRHGKIAVACKDFCKQAGALREVRTIKNAFNEELESILDTEVSSTSSSHLVDLKEIMLHMQHNPILGQVSGLEQHFWKCVLVDGFIGNNDRNNGNWGLLYEDGKYEIAPVFDNGAAFANKASEHRVKVLLADPARLVSSILQTATIYGLNDRPLNFKKMLEEGMNYPAFFQAVKETIPVIQTHMQDIFNFIESIPSEYQGLTVCSQERKQLYIQQLQLRLDKLLLPALEKVTQMEKAVQTEKIPGSLQQRIADATAHANEQNVARSADRPSPKPTHELE